MDCREFAIRLGGACRTHRLLRGYTQDHVAVAVGMPRCCYSQAENGKRQISAGELVMLARTLETTVGALLADAGVNDV